MSSTETVATDERITTARIEADTTIPGIRFTRDFAATPEQLFEAHTDPELFVRWNGPDNMETDLQVWDARTGGSWRYVTRTRTARTPSTAASTRCAPTGSCRRSPSRGSPTGWRWRRSPSRTSATAAPACTRSPSATASRAAT